MENIDYRQMDKITEMSAVNLINHSNFILCPNCRKSFKNNAFKDCLNCDWMYSKIDGISIFLSDDDKNSQFFKTYINNYDVIAQDDFLNSIQPEEYLLTQKNKMISYLGNLSGIVVCEVGVGKGYLIRDILQQKPKKLFGVDISLEFLKKLAKEHHNQTVLELMLANAENLPFYESLDVLVASDIMEHVMNVGDFLYTANKALKLGGKFVVRVPYNENLLQYSQLMGCKYDFAHLRNFSKSTLKVNLTEAGFSVDKCHFDGYWKYKTRKIFKKFRLVNAIIRWYYEKFYPGEYSIAKISNIFGRILMEPVEITVVCTKISDLCVFNEKSKID